MKVNGKTSIPSDDIAISTHTSYVEDAVRLGATGIGYTLYYGSPAQDRDLQQLASVRRECERFGMPLIIWAYPRGAAINQKGGKTSSYALESAARLAVEMGATIVKSNLPADCPDIIENPKVPKYYRDVEREIIAIEDPLERSNVRAKRIVEATQGIPVLFSGGSGKSDEVVISNARACVKAGCFGFIIGRNMWKRTYKDALNVSSIIEKALDEV